MNADQIFWTVLLVVVTLFAAVVWLHVRDMRRKQPEPDPEAVTIVPPEPLPPADEKPREPSSFFADDFGELDDFDDLGDPLDAAALPSGLLRRRKAMFQLPKVTGRTVRNAEWHGQRFIFRSHVSCRVEAIGLKLPDPTVQLQIICGHRIVTDWVPGSMFEKTWHQLVAGEHYGEQLVKVGSLSPAAQLEIRVRGGASQFVESGYAELEGVVPLIVVTEVY